MFQNNKDKYYRYEQVKKYRNISLITLIIFILFTFLFLNKQNNKNVINVNQFNVDDVLISNILLKEEYDKYLEIKDKKPEELDEIKNVISFYNKENLTQIIKPMITDKDRSGKSELNRSFFDSDKAYEKTFNILNEYEDIIKFNIISSSIKVNEDKSESYFVVYEIITRNTVKYKTIRLDFYDNKIFDSQILLKDEYMKNPDKVFS